MTLTSSLPLVPLSAFIPQVQSFVAGAPEPAMLQALRQAAAAYCEATRCWKEEFTFYISINPTDMGVGDISPFAINYATYLDSSTNFSQLKPVRVEDLPLDTYQSDMGQPDRIAIENGNSVFIYPFDTGVLTMSLFLKPSVGDTFGKGATTGAPTLQAVRNQLPAFLLADRAEVIAAGAIARLCEMPGKAWTNPGLSQAKRAEFDAGKDAGILAYTRSKAQIPVRSRSRFF